MRAAWLLLALVMCGVAQQGDVPKSSGAAEEPPKMIRVEGRVLHSLTGEPVRKVVVGLLRGREATVLVHTGDDGRFVAEVPPGRYHLSAEKAGFSRYRHGARLPQDQGQPFALEANQISPLVEVRLRPTTTLSGRVLDADGDPLPRVSVTVWAAKPAQGQRQWAAQHGGITDTLGEFRVSDLPLGQYLFSADGDRRQPVVPDPDGNGPSGYVTTFHPSAPDTTSAVPVEVRPGRDMPGLDIRLQRGRTVFVRGRLAAGSSKGPVELYLMPRERHPGQRPTLSASSAEVRRDGSFEIPHVRPGSYLLLAGFQSGPDMAGFARVPVEVGERDIEGIVLTPEPLLALAGTMRLGPSEASRADRLTTPERAAAVSIFLEPLSDWGLDQAWAEANAKGEFHFPTLLPIKYRLLVRPRGQPLYVKSVKLGDQDVANRILDLSGGVPGPLTVVCSAKVAGLTVTVRDGKEKLMAGALVVLAPEPLVPELLDEQPTGVADQNGVAVLNGLAPGRYRLYAWESLPAGASRDVELLERMADQSVVVELKESDKQEKGIMAIVAEW